MVNARKLRYITLRRILKNQQIYNKEDGLILGFYEATFKN